MGRRAGRPGGGPAPAGLRSGRGEGGDGRFAVGVIAVVGVVGIFEVQIVVEVQVLVGVFIFVLVEVDVVVFVAVVFIAVVEVAIVQVFFHGLARDLLVQSSIGFRVFPVVLADRFIDTLGGNRLVGVLGFVVMLAVGRGHGLEHRMFTGRVHRHLGDRGFVGLALLGAPAPLAARLGFAAG